MNLRHLAPLLLVALAGCVESPAAPPFWPAGALPPRPQAPTVRSAPSPSPPLVPPPRVALDKEARCRLAPDGTRLFVRRPFALEARSVPDGGVVWRRELECTEDAAALELSPDGSELSDGKRRYVAATGEPQPDASPWPEPPAGGRVRRLSAPAVGPGEPAPVVMVLDDPSDVERQRLATWARPLGIALRDEPGRLVLESARPLDASADGRAFVLVDNPVLAVGRAHVLRLDVLRSFTVRAWRAAASHYSPTPEARLEAHLSPDGTRVSLVDVFPADRALDAEARLYDTKTGQVVGDAGDVAWSPRGKWLYSPGGGALSDAATGRVQLLRAPTHRDRLPVDFDRDERLLAEGCNVYDLVLGERVMFVGPRPEYGRARAFLPDGALLDVAEHGVVVWDLGRGERLRLLDAPVPEGRVLVMDAARRVAAVATSAGIALVDLVGRRLLRVLPVAPRTERQGPAWLRRPRPRPMALAPDGSALAVLSDDALELYPWDGASAAPRRVPLGATAVPAAVAWSDDGARLALLGRAGGRHRLVVLDAASGAVVVTRDLGAVETDELRERLAFAPQRRLVVAEWPRQGELRAAFDADTGADRPLPADVFPPESVETTSLDGRFAVAHTGSCVLRRVRDGERLTLVELSKTGSDGWLALDGDGRFDGSPEAFLYLTAGEHGRPARREEAERSREPGLWQAFVAGVAVHAPVAETASSPQDR